MGPVGILTSGGFMYNHLASPDGDAAVHNEDAPGRVAKPNSHLYWRSIMRLLVWMGATATLTLRMHFGME